MLAEVILAPFAYLNVDQGFFAGAAVLFFRYFCARYFFKEYLNTAVLICFKDVFVMIQPQTKYGNKKAR